QRARALRVVPLTGRRAMDKGRQQGVSLMGLIFVLIVLTFVALFLMKVIPSYMEYSAAKKAIDEIARDPNVNSPGLVRKAFGVRATIDDINAVKPTDLEITKDGNRMVISFAYRKEVPLFTNVGLYIDYVATTEQ